MISQETNENFLSISINSNRNRITSQSPYVHSIILLYKLRLPHFLFTLTLVGYKDLTDP